MAAATGVINIGDSQPRGCLSSSAPCAPQRAHTDQTPPTFLVTQSLVSLLTEKGVPCYSLDRVEHEASGECDSLKS